MRIKYTAKKYNGDDLYSWAVFSNDRVMSTLTGLNRGQARHYVNLLKIAQVEREAEAKLQSAWHEKKEAT